MTEEKEPSRCYFCDKVFKEDELTGMYISHNTTMLFCRDCDNLVRQKIGEVLSHLGMKLIEIDEPNFVTKETIKEVYDMLPPERTDVDLYDKENDTDFA